MKSTFLASNRFKSIRIHKHHITSLKIFSLRLKYFNFFPFRPISFNFVNKTHLLRISECGVRISDCGVRISDCGVRISDYRLRSVDWGLWSGEHGLKASITRLQARRAVFLVRLVCLPIPNRVRGLKTIYGGFRIAECRLRIIDFLGKNAGFGGGLCGCLVCGRGFATAKQCVKPSKTRLQPRRAVFSLRLVSMVVSPKNQASNRLKMRFHPSQSPIHIPQSTFPNPNPFPCPQQKKFLCFVKKFVYFMILLHIQLLCKKIILH